MSELDDNRIDREYEEAVFATIVHRLVQLDDGERKEGRDEKDASRKRFAYNGTGETWEGQIIGKDEGTWDGQIIGGNKETGKGQISGENEKTDGKRMIGIMDEHSNGEDIEDEEDGTRLFTEWRKESGKRMAPERAMDQRCLKTIRGYFAKKRAKRLAKSSVKYIAGAAAMVALFCLCVGVIFPDFLEATDPVVRESILDFMAQRTANNIEYTYLYYEGTDNQLLSVETGWLPEKLEVLSYSVYDNMIQISLGETENGTAEESLRIDVYGNNMTSISYTEYEEVTVQGNLALLWEDTDDAGDFGNEISLEWYDPESEFLIWILADDMEREDVLRLAEGLTLQWEQGEWTVKDTTGFGSMDGH